MFVYKGEGLTYYSQICLTASCITKKFDNCNQIYWSRIGTNVNLYVLSENFISASANELCKTNHYLQLIFIF